MTSPRVAHEMINYLLEHAKSPKREIQRIKNTFQSIIAVFFAIKGTKEHLFYISYTHPSLI